MGAAAAAEEAVEAAKVSAGSGVAAAFIVSGESKTGGEDLRFCRARSAFLLTSRPWRRFSANRKYPRVGLDQVGLEAAALQADLGVRDWVVVFNVARPTTGGSLDVLVVADAAPADTEVQGEVVDNWLRERVRGRREGFPRSRVGLDRLLWWPSTGASCVVFMSRRCDLLLRRDGRSWASWSWARSTASCLRASSSAALSSTQVPDWLAASAT